MESYFPLSEQFLTQSEPQYCSLSSLAMVLNALNHDPKKVWRKPWRWVTEETLQCETMNVCGHSLQRVVEKGLDFNEFESLARCHGVNIQSTRAHTHHDESGVTCDGGLHKFRALVAETSRNTKADTFLVVNYSRKQLGQTGDGHFSPIGGYHEQKDSVLVLDVARFKYPPYWVSLPALWASMSAVDKTSAKCRGYFVISNWKTEQDALQGRQVEENKCPPLIRTWEAGAAREACSHGQHHQHT